MEDMASNTLNSDANSNMNTPNPFLDGEDDIEEISPYVESVDKIGEISPYVDVSDIIQEVSPYAAEDKNCVAVRACIDDVCNLGLVVRPISAISTFTASHCSTARGHNCDIICTREDALASNESLVSIDLLADLAIAIRCARTGFSTPSCVEACSGAESFCDNSEIGVDDNEQQQLHSAAVTIQKTHRGKQARREYELHLMQYKNATVEVQRLWRGRNARKAIEKQGSAAVLIQKRYRGKASRNHVAKTKATEVITKMIEGYFATYEEDPKKGSRCTHNVAVCNSPQGEARVLPPIVERRSTQKHKKRKRHVSHHVHHHHHFHHFNGTQAERKEIEADTMPMSLTGLLEHALVEFAGVKPKPQASDYCSGDIARLSARERLEYSPYCFASDFRPKRYHNVHTRVLKQHYGCTLPRIVA